MTRLLTVPIISSKYDERIKKFGTDDVIPLWIADKVGKVLYWIEGLGNFEGTTMGTEAKPKNFKINAYDLKKGLAAGEVVICTASGIPSVTVNGTVLKQDVDYTCKITVGKNDLFTFAIKGMGNYKGSVTIKETITEPVG